MKDSKLLRRLKKRPEVAAEIKKILLAETLSENSTYRMLFVETFFGGQKPSFFSKRKIRAYETKISKSNVEKYRERINKVVEAPLIEFIQKNSIRAELKPYYKKLGAKNKYLFLNLKAFPINTYELPFKEMADNTYYRMACVLQRLFLYKYYNNKQEGLTEEEAGEFFDENGSLSKIKVNLFEHLKGFKQSEEFLHTIVWPGFFAFKVLSKKDANRVGNEQPYLIKIKDRILQTPLDFVDTENINFDKQKVE